METILQSLLALAMGVASVRLFARAWLGFLGVLATWVLAARGELAWSAVPARLHGHGARGLLCGLVLVLAFRLYMAELGLGTSQQEQLFYFLGCTGCMVPLAVRLPRMVEDLFACGPEAAGPDRKPAGKKDS